MEGISFSLITTRDGKPDRKEAVKSGASSFFKSSSVINLFGDLPAFGGSILQPPEPVLHFANPALQPRGERLIGKGGPNDR